MRDKNKLNITYNIIFIMYFLTLSFIETIFFYKLLYTFIYILLYTFNYKKLYM